MAPRSRAPTSAAGGVVASGDCPGVAPSDRRPSAPSRLAAHSGSFATGRAARTRSRRSPSSRTRSRRSAAGSRPSVVVVRGTPRLADTAQPYHASEKRGGRAEAVPDDTPLHLSQHDERQHDEHDPGFVFHRDTHPAAYSTATAAWPCTAPRRQPYAVRCRARRRVTASPRTRISRGRRRGARGSDGQATSSSRRRGEGARRAGTVGCDAQRATTRTHERVHNVDPPGTDVRSVTDRSRGCRLDGTVRLRAEAPWPARYTGTATSGCPGALSSADGRCRSRDRCRAGIRRVDGAVLGEGGGRARASRDAGCAGSASRPRDRMRPRAATPTATRSATSPA